MLLKFSKSKHIMCKVLETWSSIKNTQKSQIHLSYSLNFSPYENLYLWSNYHIKGTYWLFWLL